jgi:hypothetical protein
MTAQAVSSSRPVSAPKRSACISAKDVEQAVAVFWPRFDTLDIARIYGWGEDVVANALARMKGEVA